VRQRTYQETVEIESRRKRSDGAQLPLLLLLALSDGRSIVLTLPVINRFDRVLVVFVFLHDRRLKPRLLEARHCSKLGSRLLRRRNIFYGCRLRFFNHGFVIRGRILSWSCRSSATAAGSSSLFTEVEDQLSGNRRSVRIRLTRALGLYTSSSASSSSSSSDLNSIFDYRHQELGKSVPVPNAENRCDSPC